MEKLGHFRIVGVLGSGAMGEVFHAIDEKLDRPVALKVLHLKLNSPEYAQYAARLMQEARSAARLNHQNIITMFDCGEIDGCTYLSMEMVKGRNLRSILDENPILPIPKAIQLAAELFDALAFAHQAQVVHRDIKPANLMFNAEGRLKVTDFGIAQLPNSDLTQTNVMLGSPLYMSPEQLETSRVDGRSDIFSAGVLLYESLTGHPPFTGKSIGAIAFKIVTEEPPAPSTVNPEVPQWLSDIVMHCLRKKPEDRYQTADIALAELREKSVVTPPALASTSTSTSTSTAVPTSIPTSAARTATEGTLSRSAAINQTYTSSVVFLDIVGYSKLANDLQSKLKQRFNSLLKTALDQLPQDQRVIVDTGDGAAIAFLVDQIACLHFLDRYVSLLKNYPDLQIRTGVNLGPCQVVEDINGSANLIGDGINAAQRVMSFAPTSQVLVSHSFYDVAIWISSDYAARLTFFENKKDKHGRTHKLYRFGPAATQTNGSDDQTVVMNRADNNSLHNHNANPHPHPNPASSKQWMIWTGLGVLLFILVGVAAFKFKGNFQNNPVKLATAGSTASSAENSASTPPLTAADLQTGKVFKDCRDCPDMVVLPSGSFLMGGEKNDPHHALHPVTITQSFSLGKTPVTQGQWKAVMGNNPSGFNTCGDDCPVEHVTWNDAHAYTRKLSDMTGKNYRLPSEAEWEYACRAGGRDQYCGSNDLNQIAWYSGNSGKMTHQVATKQANAWGLYDMNGNVWQWMEDCWNDTYKGAPSTGIPWTTGNCESKRVLRGGSWGNDPFLSRAESRSPYVPTGQGDSLGFRVARDLP